MINDQLLKGENVQIISENFLENGFSDKANFSNIFLNISNNNFKAGETKISLKKDTLDEFQNDPRLYGASSVNEDNILTINKGVFTSCNKNMKCPAWSIEAKKLDMIKIKDK